MMFEQCKIIIFNNIIFIKNIGNFPEKYNGNFPDKYEIFRLTSLIAVIFACIGIALYLW